MKLIKLCAPAWMDKEYPKKAKERKLQKFYNFLKSKNIVIEFYHGTSDISWELIKRDGMMSPPTWRSREKYEGRWRPNGSVENNGLDKLFFTRNFLYAIGYANSEANDWNTQDRFQEYKGIDLDRKAEPVIIKKNVPLHYLDEIKGVIYGTSVYNETLIDERIKGTILSDISDEKKLSNILSLIEGSAETGSEFTIKGSVPISREEGFQHIERMNSKDFWIEVLKVNPRYYKNVPEELKNDDDILEVRKNGWIKYLQNGRNHHLRQTYARIPEDLKNDSDILQVTKNVFIKYLSHNPRYYKYVPEVLKNDSYILKVTKNGFIKYLERYLLKNDPNTFKIYYNDVPEELKNDDDILQYAPKEEVPKEEVPKEEVTANRVFKLIRVIS
jgi:hypothetical protein